MTIKFSSSMKRAALAASLLAAGSIAGYCGGGLPQDARSPEAFQRSLAQVGQTISAAQSRFHYVPRGPYDGGACYNDRGETGFNQVNTADILASRNGECANLSHVSFLGNDLSGVNLRGANLVSAVLAGVRLQGADLTGGHLFAANLTRADFTGAVMIGMDMDGSTMVGAVLRRAVLIHTNLKGTDMRNVDFRDSDLRLADLRFSDTTGCDFHGALYNDFTLLPFGRGVAKQRGMVWTEK